MAETTASPADLLKALSTQFDLVNGNPRAVAEACEALRRLPDWPADPALVDSLLPLLSRRGRKVSAPLFELLAEAAAAGVEARNILLAMLHTPDEELLLRALQLAGRLAPEKLLPVDAELLQRLALRTEEEDSPLTGEEGLAALGGLLDKAEAEGITARALFRDPATTPELRRLAARVLDHAGQTVACEHLEDCLPAGAANLLRPLLEYTRASWLDLAWLCPEPGRDPPALASIRRALEQVGDERLRQALAAIGWQRLWLGLEVRRLVEVEPEGSLPFQAPRELASVLRAFPGPARERVVYYAVGGAARKGERQGAEADEVVTRFQRLNLEHAAVLDLLMDFAPLSGERVREILARMDGIVELWGALFAEHSPEAAILPEVYGDLRGRALEELGRETRAECLSPELTRLVQAFEDPASLAATRTLHGLKRYLHQKGLALGPKLVERRGGSAQSVDVVIQDGPRELLCLRRIRFLRFEPEEADAGAAFRLPAPVALLAESFARQALAGWSTFPHAELFCYGHEVHLYLYFRNHPAFIRINDLPPALGGMIDLEYYGVSQYELGEHPGRDLPVIRECFRALDFGVEREGVRLRARYDKERVLSLEDLQRQIAALFRLTPLLMDLDWILGSTDYDRAEQALAVPAWAQIFRHWGFLPLERMLSFDRTQIIEEITRNAAGERRMHPWEGDAPYPARFRTPLREDWRRGLLDHMQRLGLDLPRLTTDTAPFGQLDLERRVLTPLGEALARRQIRRVGEDLQADPRFRILHEAPCLAELLEDPKAARPAIALARCVARLARATSFATTGSIGQLGVRRARLALQEGVLTIGVLCDRWEMPRLALFGQGDTLWRFGDESNVSRDPAVFTRCVRQAGYALETVEGGEEDPEPLLEALRRQALRAPRRDAYGERRIPATIASRGRAVGLLALGTAGRRPEEMRGRILAVDTLRPEDAPFLARAEGIVSTGGGVLSHAGIAAVQLGRPALVIRGSWRPGPRLLAAREDFEEQRESRGAFQVHSRRLKGERPVELREGEVVVLDARQGCLIPLGGPGPARALHDLLADFAAAWNGLRGEGDEARILERRGRLLRARHLLGRLLAGLDEEALVYHAVEELLLGCLAVPGREARSALFEALRRGPLGERAMEWVAEALRDVEQRLEQAVERARQSLPFAQSLVEALGLRLDALRLEAAREEALAATGGDSRTGDLRAVLDPVASERLEELRRRQLQAARSRPEVLRHTLRQLRRIDRVLGRPEDGQRARLARQLEREDDARRERLKQRLVLPAAECGLALGEQIGWKAANLAELGRIAGPGRTPPWCVVTDAAFRRALRTPLGAGTLEEQIRAVLSEKGLDPRGQAARIADLWQQLTLPPELVEEILAGWRALGGDGPLVAIRSSGVAEDRDSAALAGEFDTYLFIQGSGPVIDHVKRAWSGLWSERALYHGIAGDPNGPFPGGGILVQQIARCRVSGVLTTIDMAGGDYRSMAVDAGLGLGEGVVSGRVPADHVVVEKKSIGGEGPLRLRYLTADKPSQVVFNESAGMGTECTETLYHQRIRPALEYVELAELVALAAELERAWGIPLNIEWGLEDAALRILQVRPLPVWLPVLHETLERFPIRKSEEEP